jgi:hypothetical protein
MPMIQGHPDPTGNGLCHALADCELLVEPMKSEGISELYRRNAEAAEPRDKPQPTQTTWAIGSMEWLAEQKKSR